MNKHLNKTNVHFNKNLNENLKEYLNVHETFQQNLNEICSQKHCQTCFSRYLIVCHPFYTVSHSWSGKRYAIPILIWSLLYNFPKFFELHTTFDEAAVDQPGQGYLVNASEMRLNEYYIKIYCIWMNFVFMGLIPFVALIILNAQTLRSLVLKVIFMKKELKYGT